jgi:hypothetical protein
MAIETLVAILGDLEFRQLIRGWLTASQLAGLSLRRPARHRRDRIGFLGGGQRQR